MKRLFFISLLVGSAVFSSQAHANHSSRLRVLHPYALLGDDFGILTTEDLASNAKEAIPEPFSEDSISYPHWQCFETRVVSMICDSIGYNDSEKAHLAILGVVVKGQNESQEYLARRPMSVSSCRRYKKEWKKLTAGQSHVCVSGPFSRTDRSEPSHPVQYWAFDKYKTRKGCDSYFDGACER